MSDYHRSTRECEFKDFPPHLRKAILDYMRTLGVEDVTANLLFCGETISERKESFLAAHNGDPDSAHRTAILLTPVWLVWARSGEKSGTHVHAARLAEIQVQDYNSKLAARLTGDAGVELSGTVQGENRLVKGMIGLGNDPAAEKFKTALMAAWKLANPNRPASNTWLATLIGTRREN